MLKKNVAGLAGFFTFFTVSAQDSIKTAAPTSLTTFIYSIDGYYKTDFADQLLNNKTSFTNSNNSFELGMASIRVDHSFGKVAATVDLGFGRRANENSYNDIATMQIIKQVFVTYALSSKIKFTFGKFFTHIGYEVLDAYANRNYSMSYAFSYGPFFHTGLKADILLGGKTAIMVGIANPTDYTTDTAAAKMFIAQFSTGTKNDKFKAYLNYQGGTKENHLKMSQFDLVLNGVVSSKFGINYDGTICNLAGYVWSSNAIYLNYNPTNKFGLALRGEYFDNTNRAPIATDHWGNAINTSVFAATLSANFYIGNLTIIPEIRLDNAKDKIFLNSSSEPATSSGNVLIAAVYKF